MVISRYVNHAHTIQAVTILLLWLHGIVTLMEKESLRMSFAYGQGSEANIRVVGMYREYTTKETLNSKQVVIRSESQVTKDGDIGHAVYITVSMSDSATLIEYWYNDYVRIYHKKDLELKLKSHESVINLTIADSVCVGGWSPYFCPHSKPEYSVKPNWADKYDAEARSNDANIKACTGSSAIQHWNISVRSRYETVELLEEYLTRHIDQNVGTIEKFYLTWKKDCTFSPPFHFYMNMHVEYHTAHNIYKAYMTVFPQRNEVHELFLIISKLT